MSLLFILILVVLTIIFFLGRHRKTAWCCLIFTVVVFLAIGTGLVPSLLLTDLQSPFITLNKDWGKNNAIVVLGGGITKLPHTHEVKPSIIAYSRIYEADLVYLACKKDHHACTIILSGGDPSHRGHSEAEVYQQALLAVGVPSKDIILEDKSLNTYMNAENTSALLKKGQFDQIVLVTSGIHIKRSLRYFSHFNIQAVPQPADYLTAMRTWVPLSYNFTMTDFALHEYIGIVRFYIYNLLGWNK